MALIREAKASTSTGLVDGWDMWCPGCEDMHVISNAWSFDGDHEAPTFSPSILVNYGRVGPDGMKRACHSFVVAGQWQFLSDSTHPLAGQTVPMVPIP